MRTIHVFGDSHTMYFLGEPIAGGRSNEFHEYKFKNDTLFKVMKLGDTGATIFGLSSHDSKTGANRTLRKVFSKHEIKEAIFILGEVDCRGHLIKCPRDVKEGLYQPTFEESVGQVILILDSFIKEISKDKNIKFNFCCVHPASVQTYKSVQEQKAKQDVRVAIKEFNKQLKEYCQKHNFGCVDLFDKFVEGDELIQQKWLLDDGGYVHMNPTLVQEMYIEEFLKLEQI